MMKKVALPIGLSALLACAGCSHSAPNRLPVGAAAYEALAKSGTGVHTDEVVQPNDRLAIKVLGEPELTSDSYYVDANGFIQIPLAGEINAAGQTPRQIREAISKNLAAHYIRDPQVAVIVIERTRNTFSVEGDVREPGVFEVGPDTTLLTAIARAKSPTNVAKLTEVMIFRTVDGQHMGARFDIRQIRAGNAEDPRVQAGDMIVVGHSTGKAFFRDVLQAAPLFNVFYLLATKN